MRCRTMLDTGCGLADGHQGPHESLYWHAQEPIAYIYFPPGLGAGLPAASEMYANAMEGMVPADPLATPLPPIAPNADWATKDRQIEWVLHNFTDGMKAKLYKMIYMTQKTKDGWQYRMDNVEDIVRKEKP